VAKIKSNHTQLTQGAGRQIEVFALIAVHIALVCNAIWTLAAYLNGNPLNNVQNYVTARGKHVKLLVFVMLLLK
jgi:hypothetical protein